MMFQPVMHSTSVLPPVIGDIAQWINANFGIFFPENKYSILHNKLSRLCAERGITLEELWDQVLLGRDSILLTDVAAAVSTNHTSFFREDIWDYFRGTILPALPDVEYWRFWSAAASAGHEAYTMAMVVRDYLDTQSLNQRVGILGTDISSRVLSQAEEALYTHDMIAHVPDLYRNMAFEPAGRDMWRVKSHLRNMCIFRRLNLKVQPWPMKQKFHVIFCRNVLYYFDRATRQAVVDGLFRYADQGAWLVTSATETMRDIKTEWKQVRPSVYRKH